MLKVGRDLWRPPGPLLWSRKATLGQLPRNMSRQLLNISKKGGSATSLGNLYQSLDTLTVRNCFLTVRGNLLCLILCFLPLLLSLGTTKKRQAQSFLHSSFKYLYTSMRSFLRPLFLRLNSPTSLSLSLGKKCSNPLSTVVAFHWTPVYPWPSGTLKPRTGHSAPDVASPVPYRVEGSPPSTCWQYFVSCSQGHNFPSLQQGHVDDSCSTPCPPGLQGP